MTKVVPKEPELKVVSFDEFKENLSLMTPENAQTLVSRILKEYETEGKLGHLVEILIIQDAAEKFLMSIIINNPLKSELIAKMNTLIQKDDESITLLTDDHFEDQLPR